MKRAPIASRRPPLQLNAACASHIRQESLDANVRSNPPPAPPKLAVAPEAQTPDFWALLPASSALRAPRQRLLAVPALRGERELTHRQTKTCQIHPRPAPRPPGLPPRPPVRPSRPPLIGAPPLASLAVRASRAANASAPRPRRPPPATPPPPALTNPPPFKF